MTARGLSQNALARRAGMPPTMLHRAIAGERRLSLDELGAIAGALDLEPEHLLWSARQPAQAADTDVPPSGERSESNSEPRQE